MTLRMIQSSGGADQTTVLEVRAIAETAAANALSALQQLDLLGGGGGVVGGVTYAAGSIDPTNLPDGSILVEFPEGTVF